MKKEEYLKIQNKLKEKENKFEARRQKREEKLWKKGLKQISKLVKTAIKINRNNLVIDGHINIDKYNEIYDYLKKEYPYLEFKIYPGLDYNSTCLNWKLVENED